MQNNQHGHLHSWGATEGQDEADGAPDPEADEYERNEDQLLISHGGGGASLQPAPLTDEPVFRERLVLCGEQGAENEAEGPLTRSPMQAQCPHRPRKARGGHWGGLEPFTLGGLSPTSSSRIARPDRTSPQK